jgi:hypothetical protein
MNDQKEMQEVTKLDWNSSVNQRVKEKLVSREIVTCFSYEMEQILALNDSTMVTWDDIENGYYEACPHCGEEVEWEECEEEGKCIECSEELFENDLESEPQEIMEWWIVSKFWYEKVRDMGQPVLEWGNNYYWGRCGTGQAILLDGTASRIAQDMGILETQENHKYWAE